MQRGTLSRSGNVARVPLPIEDYALIGDTHTAALVGRDGSIDWLCLPRFDSGACFAALLGDPSHGRWLLVAVGPVPHPPRLPRGHPRPRDRARDRHRRRPGDRVHDPAARPGARGAAGRGRARAGRHAHGAGPPVRLRRRRPLAAAHAAAAWPRVAGPDAVELRTGVPVEVTRGLVEADFTVAAGQRVAFAMVWYPSHQEPPPQIDPWDAAKGTTRFWREWVGRCTYDGEWRDAVMRSLITLKAMTYRPTGGIVAAVDDVAARADRRGPQLGLPVLLAPRRDVHALRPADGGLRARGGGLARVAPARGRRRPARPADHVRHLRASAGCTRWSSTGSPGYEGSRPVRVGNDAVAPVPAGRLRRGPRPAAPGRARGPAARGGVLGGGAAAHRRARVALARARRRHLGGPRRRAALHALEGDGVGRGRPGRSATSSCSGSRARWTDGGRSATRSTPRSAARGSTPRSGAFMQSYGGRRARRRRPC